MKALIILAPLALLVGFLWEMAGQWWRRRQTNQIQERRKRRYAEFESLRKWGGHHGTR